MPDRSKKAARIASAILGLVFGLVGAELTFGQLRPAAGMEQQKPEPLLYSIELRDGAGALVANPLLVGEENQPVRLSLSRDLSVHRSLEMSLELRPESQGTDNLCLGYKVTIDDGKPRSGKLGTKYGARRSVEVRNSRGEPLRLSLVVARARTPAFDRILLARRKPAA
jgi:hypothetical protein